MKEYTRLFVFIIVLGLLVSGIYVGMTVLTAERIEANKLYELKVATLSSNFADMSSGLDEAFDRDITIVERNGYTFYLYLASEDLTSFEGISIIYTGEGLWGSIRGIITFEEDFITIKNINVLEQEETPGLGGKITTRAFLNGFIGKKFDPEIRLTSGTGNKPENEVDAIVGATGTSVALQNILNTNYVAQRSAFYDIDPNEGSLDKIKQTVLFNLDIDYTDDDFLDLFESNVDIIVYDDLTYYLTDTTISYVISGEGAFGIIEGVITLENDFETIVKLSIFESSEVWGSDVHNRDYLDQFTGKRFINDEIVFTTDPTEENEVDVIGRGTTTQEVFPEMINDSYIEYKTTYENNHTSGTSTMIFSINREAVSL